MIEIFYLNEWRQKAPWLQLFQIEQDLIISRALVELYERSMADIRLFRDCCRVDAASSKVKQHLP